MPQNYQISSMFTFLIVSTFAVGIQRNLKKSGYKPGLLHIIMLLTKNNVLHIDDVAYFE